MSTKETATPRGVDLAAGFKTDTEGTLADVGVNAASTARMKPAPTSGLAGKGCLYRHVLHRQTAHPMMPNGCSGDVPRSDLPEDETSSRGRLYPAAVLAGESHDGGLPQQSPSLVSSLVDSHAACPVHRRTQKGPG